MKKTVNKKGIKEWALAHAKGPFSTFWLALFSFAESSFFPIPPDAIMIAILLLKQQAKWIYYATITTVFSVAGGLFGYLIGFLFFEAVGGSIVSFYNLESHLATVASFFSNNAFFTIFLAAFTPIPYKVFTISAGLFKIDIFIFIIASILGRAIRFFAIAYFVKLYGKRIASVLYKYFNVVSIAVVIIIGVIIYLLV
ncbi:cytochrome B [Candidatus Wolfebacteria bacterium]|nr:MAG: cytochrome B [Candidatus Wolfebacteria bacterium]